MITSTSHRRTWGGHGRAPCSRWWCPIDPPINVCSPEELIEAIAEQDKLALNARKIMVSFIRHGKLSSACLSRTDTSCCP